MTYTLGFSPCPNDTFIFYALIHKKIDLRGLDFEFVIEDVEFLNKAALIQKLDVTKMSYFAYSKMLKNYHMLSSGGALGSNCGPLLVSSDVSKDINPESSVAIPGIHTTANLLLSLAYPLLQNKVEVIFSEIESTVKNGKYDFGLIIHESRFTYRKKGLFKVKDLGEFWEETTLSPIPLGGIAIDRNFSDEVKITITQIIRDSVMYAFEHRHEAMPYIRSLSQELDDEVINAHINLYVNEYTKSLGQSGIKGVKTFFKTLKDNGFIDEYEAETLVVGQNI